MEPKLADPQGQGGSSVVYLTDADVSLAPLPRLPPSARKPWGTASALDGSSSRGFSRLAVGPDADADATEDADAGTRAWGVGVGVWAYEGEEGGGEGGGEGEGVLMATRL